MTKKAKKKSPFRIKVASVVALRYRPGGNQVEVAESLDEGMSIQPVSFYGGSSTPFTDVWCDPKPGFDEGLALVGRCVRCIFPKLVLSKSFHKQTAGTRILEGEIISVVNYGAQFGEQRKRRRQREAHGTLVDLLISKDRLEAMPFLNEFRSDIDVDVSKLSESARREYMNEERVKGGNKCVVRITLADSSGLVVSCLTNRLETKWVIRKRVPTKRLNNLGSYPFGGPNIVSEGNQGEDKRGNDEGEKLLMNSGGKRQKIADSTPKYLGDGNDTAAQQEANWRWQSTKSKPCISFKTLPVNAGCLSSMLASFVGEVVQVTPGSLNSKSLAMVTCKRLLLPEHTEWGRLSSHHANEIFEDFDSLSSFNGRENKGKIGQPSFYYRFPVEDLVIISRRLEYTGDSVPRNGVFLTSAYSFRMNLFIDKHDTAENDDFEASEPCCRCRKFIGNNKEDSAKSAVCFDCLQTLKGLFSDSGDQHFPSKDVCECCDCQKRREQKEERSLLKKVSEAAARIEGCMVGKMHDQRFHDGDTEFIHTRYIIKRMTNINFHMFADFLPTRTPSSKPVLRIKKRSPKKLKKASTHADPVAFSGNIQDVSAATSQMYPHDHPAVKGKVMEICCRILPYDKQSRTWDSLQKTLSTGMEQSIQIKDRQRNMRSVLGDLTSRGEEKKTTKGKSLDSRSLRANQRRLLRDIAAIGVSLDTLAGREQHLRFDRSNIHAWGVFADIDIKENEMLVEYRGEIIGNSMSEKREKEYEKANLPDYMFRIDGQSVCDATKQGNVARFINHSCEPNCFTKIISIEGVKRIAVYAKTDIPAGDELSYDYKFPLEYDTSRRISCNCGSRECRGFMNWDKRYVAVSPDAGQSKAAHHHSKAKSQTKPD